MPNRLCHDQLFVVLLYPLGFLCSIKLSTSQLATIQIGNIEHQIEHPGVLCLRERNTMGILSYQHQLSHKGVVDLCHISLCHIALCHSSELAPCGPRKLLLRFGRHD